MPVVSVKPRFQATVPGRQRRNIDLREGDITEATFAGGGILSRPGDPVDRDAAASRIGGGLAATRSAPRGPGRSKDGIKSDSIAGIVPSRREGRHREEWEWSRTAPSARSTTARAARSLTVFCRRPPGPEGWRRLMANLLSMKAHFRISQAARTSLVHGLSRSGDRPDGGTFA